MRAAFAPAPASCNASDAHATPRIAPLNHDFERAARRGTVPHARPVDTNALPGPLAWDGGAPLPAPERRHFEQLFGQDFSAVRVHADEGAARLAHGLRAHAFTSGSHIGFARGRFQLTAPEGRALLRHELVHVAQLRTAGAASAEAAMLWRAPDDESLPGTPSLPILDIAVTTMVDGIGDEITLERPEQPIDKTALALFEGDILAIGLRDIRSMRLSAVADSFPPGVERSESSTDERLLLRMTAPTEHASLRIHAAGAAEPSAVLTLRVAPRQEPAGAIHTARKANETASTALDTERRDSRRARQDEWRSLRGAPAEERRAARRARRDERRDERARARELRHERRQQKKTSSCSLEIERAIDAGVRRGVQVADTALASLAKQPLSPAVLAALATYLKLDPTQDRDAAPRLQRVIDVLSTARNSLAAVGADSFECGQCDEETGAFVTEHARGGLITVCQLWRTGIGFKFEWHTSLDESRAYALLHEFVHLSGVTSRGVTDKEVYVADKTAWARLTPERLANMADAYASIAWATGARNVR